MSGELLAFLALSLIAIMGGVLMLNFTKVMHMMLALVFTFLSIAGLYITLSAEFVGVVQVLIYSGAVTIIMIFGIMLTKQDDESEGKSKLRSLLVFIGVVAFGAVMYYAVNNTEFTPATDAPALHKENTKQIGEMLYTKYIIPFELVSVLLLVALVGAIILAKGDGKEEGRSHE
ncbi:NADH-quinone oxidoreductase subunit J [Ectobacillus funiculus]|uniref:NADH-quinone oxidoreductase subunit J n=1 Tax=Ectobacillus funiculus TaxID=137993 RepID=A0ABV5WK76_9BACI